MLTFSKVMTALALIASVVRILLISDNCYPRKTPKSADIIDAIWYLGLGIWGISLIYR